jgi:BirA family biotin operon repressor/biotin-[acetyl-CoA-carboxylase] ligase
MYIAQTNSTNTLLKELLARGEWPEGETYMYAGYQTAGRGQTGNGWESEKGKNLLCSIVIKSTEYRIQNTDRISPFYLNVAVSVAVYRTIRELGISELAIKWPNDIYWRDKKIAGILIENAILGSEMTYSIAGIGLNVNQTEFVSGAPNPVSLKQITGKEQDIDALMLRLNAEVQRALEEDVWAEYKAHLYRREGYWSFVEREVSIAPTMNVQRDNVQCTKAFLARIEDVLPTGELVLRDRDNKKRIYHFKQIRYVV